MYYAVFGNSFLSEVDTYNVALIELTINTYSVYTQYVEHKGAKRNRIRRGAVTNFTAAKIEFDMLVEQKRKIPTTGRRYIPNPEFKMADIDVTLMSDEQRKLVIERHQNRCSRMRKPS